MLDVGSIWMTMILRTENNVYLPYVCVNVWVGVCTVHVYVCMYEEMKRCIGGQVDRWTDSRTAMATVRATATATATAIFIIESYISTV